MNAFDPDSSGTGSTTTFCACARPCNLCPKLKKIIGTRLLASAYADEERAARFRQELKGLRRAHGLAGNVEVIGARK